MQMLLAKSEFLTVDIFIELEQVLYNRCSIVASF